MTIKLYNTKTRAKETLAPLDPQNVRMYVCGPTVYDRAHLGNARPAIVFDVLFRLLRHEYGADHVTYVRNFTDVDDKINARAARDGKPISEITAETTQWYLDDMAAVGVMEPNHMPRATQYIPQMVAMIKDLITKGHAYAAEGHVLFAVDSYKAYGALSGRSVDDMIAGARVEVAPYKRNPMDFVLWKPSDDDTPGWDSPWGRGRPGWHIECSAMSYELLGESFDIHGGGNDLMFPHHENEIAQSCCAHPEGGFAKIWLHNEMLQVEGKKMSKSLGNFFTVRDLLDQGVPGEVIRFVMLSTHYRKPMDWTEKKAKEAEATLHDWLETTMDLVPTPIESFVPDRGIVEALSDDLNTHLALSRVRLLKGERQALLDNARFLGLLSDDARKQFMKLIKQISVGVGTTPELANLDLKLDELRIQLMMLRETAMKTKDFSEVDGMKAKLTRLGLKIMMSKHGTEIEVDWASAGSEMLTEKNDGRLGKMIGIDRNETADWLVSKLKGNA